MLKMRETSDKFEIASVAHLHCTERTICLANRVQVSLPRNDMKSGAMYIA